MNKCTLDWVKRMNDEHCLRPKSVLDIGGRDDNGTPRYSFPDSDYISIDVRNGRGVDLVLSVYRISGHFGKESFDAVLALNVFEHLGDIGRALDEVYSVLKLGGYFYISMPGFGYPEHNCPGDYWRVTEQAVREIIMQDYDILSLEHAKTEFGKYPVINCLGYKRQVWTT